MLSYNIISGMLRKKTLFEPKYKDLIPITIFVSTSLGIEHFGIEKRLFSFCTKFSFVG